MSMPRSNEDQIPARRFHRPMKRYTAPRRQAVLSGAKRFHARSELFHVKLSHEKRLA
jgi:hypothetical protein